MCIGAAAFEKTLTLAQLTVVPDLMSYVAIKFLPPKELPPLSCRGILISVISIGHLAFSDDPHLSVAACLYGLTLQGISICNLGMQIYRSMPQSLSQENVEPVQSHENNEAVEIWRDRLNDIRQKMQELNHFNISVRRFRLRLNNIDNRYVIISEQNFNDFVQTSRNLYNDFLIYYREKLGL